MVSTRGVKIKFSEGERVLCYEPDPTKAKVLYDSKVLQVVHNKEAKGRKQVEYLIHFQGWNASWDRRVPEDYVLRDTEENRELQKELAEKAHIKLSIKSNRVLLGSGSSSKERKRRRRLSETIRETIERERKNRAESDTSSQTGTATTEDDVESLSSSGVGSATTTTNNEHDDEDEDEDEDNETDGEVERGTLSDEEAIARLIPFTIPDPLKSVIEKDYFLINEKNKLVNLPASKNALSILEDYVKFFVLRYVARNRVKRKSEPREKDKAFLTVDLCKEVMDGIRVCFDFYLHSLLLYPREREQALKIKNAKPVKIEKPEKEVSTPKVNSHSKDASTVEEKENKSQAKDHSGQEETKKVEVTPRRILRSKKPPPETSPATTETKEPPRQTTTTAATTTTMPQLRHHHSQHHGTHQQHPIQPQPQPPPPQPTVTCESGRSTPSTLTSGASARDGTITLPLTEMSLLNLSTPFRGLHNWTLLPENYRNPPTPVLLYGPVHLLRLFVKIPEILYRMNLPADRRKVVIHHINLFLEYLSMHITELFPDNAYINYADA